MRILAICVLLASSLSFGQTQKEVPGVFVSTQWLADHLDAPDLVVLHVSFHRPEYRAGHIPGARFLWYDWLTVSTPDASTEMPTAEHADSVLGNLGIGNASRIVLCFSGSSVSATTRTFLALCYFGIGARTFILDGGLERWKAEQRPVSSDTPSQERCPLTIRTKPSVVVDANWVRAHLQDPTVAIVDVRDRRYYEGSGGGVARTGHIKGARSIPFSALLDSTNTLQSPTVLRTIFAQAGITPGMTIVSYCHVGQQATLLYAVARELGYDAAVYDGSFQDWNVRGEDYPVEKPESNAK